MKTKYLKGLFAILIVLVFTLPVLAFSMNADAASRSNGQSWAKVIYENVTIDAGGNASKITEESDQQKVLDLVDQIKTLKVNYYRSEHSTESNHAIKELLTHDKNETFLTSPEIDESQSEIRVEYDDGLFSAWYSEYCDFNDDGIVTYGEYLEAREVSGYDYDKDKAIYYNNVYGGNIYAFSLDNASNPVTVHLEGRRNIDDWEIVGESYGYDGTVYRDYRYKYGRTMLICPEEDENNNVVGFDSYPFEHFMSDCVIFHYNEILGKWEKLNKHYASDENGRINADLRGNGMYVIVNYEDYGEEPDESNLDVVIVDADTPETGNIISVDESTGQATVNDAVTGISRIVDISVVQEGSVFRMYNPNTGEHFYTKSETECDQLVKAGWNHEDDQDFTVVDAGDDDAIPVYRLYNPNDGGMHFYTENASETRGLSKVGWIYEGISHYVYKKTSTKGAIQYRLYNPNSSNGAHHWTSDVDEWSFLKSIGWNDEGPCWRIL